MTWPSAPITMRSAYPRTLTGRLKTVDSGGVAAIAPPVINSVTSTETRTLACSVGMPALVGRQRWVGDMTERRTVTTVSTQFEWDTVPTTQSAATNLGGGKSG